MSLKVDAIDSREGMRALEPAWRSVWRRDPDATPFHSPDWLLPWTQWLWGGGRLRILAVRKGGDTVALAPFFLWGFGARPEIIRVSFLGAGITDYLGIVADPEYQLDAARAILDHLAAASGLWHVCDLQELRPGSPLLRAELPHGMAAEDGPCGVCPVVALPETADDLMAGLDAKFRRNLRVAESRLEREGARYAAVAAEDVEQGVRELIRLHEARWRGRHEPGMLATPALQNFHLEAARGLAAEGLVRMYTLRIGGEVVAIQYNLWRNGRVYAYLSGFDPAFQRSSPGAALLAHSIRCAIGEGATEFDFLRNREQFKYEWGARDRVNRSLIISTAAYARDVA